jgi:hypothetical protein
MAEISKQALKVQNNTEFPNNNNGAITPSNLRTFNVNMIDSLVDELSYNVDSGSWNQQIDALEQFTASASGLTTGSLLVTASAAGNVITFRKGDSSTFNVTVATGSIPDISNLNQATASLQAYTASANVRFTNLESTTASLNTSVTNINTFTASAAVSITNLNASSASQQTSINNLNGATGSYATTGSNTFTSANTFTSISASSFVSASQFVGDGSKITGITASIALPILDEGIPQGNAFSMNFTGSAISAIVVGGTAVVSVNVPDTGSFNSLTASFNSYTASTDADLAAIHQATASLQSNSASVNTSITNINSTTASLVTSITNLNTFSASALVSISNLNTNSASVNTSITNVNSATASLFTSVNNINTFTQSAQISINALNAATSSYVTSAITASSLVTASFDNGTRNLTFTKGDASTFNVNIPDVSGSTINTGSFVTTSSFNAYTQSNDQRVTSLEANSASVNTSITNINSSTSSLFSSASLAITTASVSGTTMTFAKGNGTTFNVTLPTGSGGGTTDTGSLLVTASAFTNTITFTKGDGTTFPVTVTTGSLNYVTGSYGAFQDSTTQSGSANTAYKFKFNTTDVSDGVILSGSTGLKVGAYGVYNLQWSGQAVQGSGAGIVSVWVNVNGIEIAGTRGDVTIPSNTKLLPAWTYLLTLNQNDVVELLWASDSGNTTWQYLPTGATPTTPAAASIIVSLNRVDVGGGSNSVSNTTFNSYTASNDQKVNSLISATGSYAITGSNTFNGNQIVNGYVSASNGYFSNENITAFNVADGSNIRFWSGSVGGADFYNIQLVPGTGGDIAFSRSGAGNVKVMTLAGVAGNNTTFQNNPVVFNNSVSSLTVNAQSTAISGSGSYTLQASTISNTAVSATTTATSSVIGTFSVTGQSGGDGRAIMLGHSGSLVLGNSGVNTYYAALGHLSSSAANANTNFIFKTNTNTGDTIISGSGNIFTNPVAATAGFKRYIGGSQNYFGLTLPQITGSAGFSPSMNNNITATGILMRLPVSSSAYTMNGNVALNAAASGIVFGTAAATNFEKAVSGLNFNSNFVGGILQTTAYKTPLSASVNITNNNVGGTLALNMDSSSINFNNGIVQGTLTVNNSYFPSTYNNQSAILGVSSFINVGSNTIYASGSNATFTSGRTIAGGSSMLGNVNVMSASLNGDNAQIQSTHLIGYGLNVLGTNLIQTSAVNDFGSVFIGRNNAIDGNRNRTAETVFAVGTGDSTTRKTGFLIDSGSNTFVEGTLNVSGSTTITGSLTISSSAAIELNVVGNSTFTGSVAGNVVSASITSNTASIDFNLGNYFEVTSSVTPLHLNVTNIKPGTTSTLIISASASSSILFSPNVAQPTGNAYSGSAGSIDILSLVAFNTSKVNLVATKALV